MLPRPLQCRGPLPAREATKQRAHPDRAMPWTRGHLFVYSRQRTVRPMQCKRIGRVGAHPGHKKAPQVPVEMVKIRSARKSPLWKQEKQTPTPWPRARQPRPPFWATNRGVCRRRGRAGRPPSARGRHDREPGKKSANQIHGHPGLLWSGNSARNIRTQPF